MKNAAKLLILCALVTFASSADAMAQRPRAVDNSARSDATRTPPPPAPAVIKAKYEGGIYGYSKRMNGTLSFDDPSRRLVFRNEKQKEIFSIPYTSIDRAYPDTRSKRPVAATVASQVPFYGIPAAFIRKKYRYMTLQFRDPDSRVSGLASFKMDNKQILDSALYTLGGKAGLAQTGDAYLRRPAGDQAATVIAIPVDPYPRRREMVVDVGLLNGKAITLPQPSYPEDARKAGAAGTVVVQVTVDEAGNVITAHALSGDSRLQEASIEAARQAKFSITKIDGLPVKVTGTLSYNFSAQ